MTLALRTVTAAAVASPVRPARGAATASPALTRLFSGKKLIRAAVHLACWAPFITCAANSWRGPWRAVGDGARTALVSWQTFSAQIPLVGQANELPHAPHDLGPLQFWLLAAPVHIDPDRGVLWGAVLLAILAASLTVEAGYSVRGETGGLLAGGIVVATVAWYPGFAAWPYDNPNFGMMFFLAALSACLAVLSGHRQWWPVLVATASIAAQAYLTYVGVSVGLVLIAVVVGLADGFRAKGGYGWLIAGLAAGAACWIAPLVQQFTSPAGKGNMSLLLHGDEGRQVGFAFAMKVMASFAAPSSLWWRESLNWWPDLYQKITSRPAALGFVILAITAAGLVIAVRWLRSRELAGLAAISLLVSVTAAAVFARIPVQAFAVHGAGGFQHLVNDVPLIFVMFIAALLPWLTVICVTALAVVKLISDRRLTPLLVRGTAALLIVMTALLVLVVQSVENYAGTGEDSMRVGAALATIQRSLPRHRLITLSVSSARNSDRYPVSQGLEWALTGDGYHFDTMRSRRSRTISQIAVVIRGRRLTIRIKQKWCRPVADTPAMRHRLCAPGV